jgi:kynureninase
MIYWERSHEWVLYKTYYCRTSITIYFQQDTPSVAEMFAVRKCLPQFCNIPLAELRESIAKVGSLFLGEMDTREAREIITVTRNAGLNTIEKSRSFISYLPHDLTTNHALIIEDEVESQSVAAEMIKAGIPIKLIEG